MIWDARRGLSPNGLGWSAVNKRGQKGWMENDDLKQIIITPEQLEKLASATVTLAGETRPVLSKKGDTYYYESDWLSHELVIQP
jgi:hypothetical protein